MICTECVHNNFLKTELRFLKLTETIEIVKIHLAEFIVNLCCNFVIEIVQVLETKKGIPITLCIIYHEVAKRLGIVCEPVSFPQHFLLKWKEYPQ